MRVSETSNNEQELGILAFLHGNEQKGKSAMLREIGITRRQFHILGMRNGFDTGAPMTFGAIADHYHVSETAIRKSFYKAEEKVRAWARTRMGVHMRPPRAARSAAKGSPNRPWVDGLINSIAPKTRNK